LTKTARLRKATAWQAGIAGCAAQPIGPESPRPLDNEIILWVLIPAYNEADQIAENLSLIHAETSKTGFPTEMIVIDDGSTDNTWQVLKKMAEQTPELKAVRFSRNSVKSWIPLFD
jgi:cellulose synthase/poly-beta-1,6-N-acetylglucosamine synthase-like glycosyltransferase